jgi:hypothetical protein
LDEVPDWPLEPLAGGLQCEFSIQSPNIPYSCPRVLIACGW